MTLLNAAMRYWHKQPCTVMLRASYRKGVRRNCLIKLATGLMVIVPCRALRKEVSK